MVKPPRPASSSSSPARGPAPSPGSGSPGRPAARPPSGAGTAARGGRLPAAERKEAILAAALPVFATRGAAGATTRDLAKAAGVTEPILYRHFPSKDDLFAAVVARATERVLARIEEIVGKERGATARLVALVTRIEELLRDADLELRVLNGAAATQADPATVALLRDAYTQLGTALSKALHGGGLRRGVSPSVAGHLLLEVGLGASLLRPVGVATIADEGYGREVLSLLIAALIGPNRQ